MSNPVEKMQSVKTGVAALAACVVQTMEELQPGTRKLFLIKLEEAYRELRDSERSKGVDCLEILSWTREMITGFNPVKGKGESFIR